MSAIQEQAKPEAYVPEQDLSKRGTQVFVERAMDKSWFLEQVVLEVKDEVVPEQNEPAF